MITEVETVRLVLRQWWEEDLDAYARMCADPEVMRHFPYVLAGEESEAQVGRFFRQWEERGFGLWAVEEKASSALSALSGCSTTKSGARASTRRR